MSEYLSSLVARNLTSSVPQPAGEIQPRLHSRFEPNSPGGGLLSGSDRRDQGDPLPPEPPPWPVPRPAAAALTSPAPPPPQEAGTSAEAGPPSAGPVPVGRSRRGPPALEVGNADLIPQAAPARRLPGRSVLPEAPHEEPSQTDQSGSAAFPLPVRWAREVPESNQVSPASLQLLAPVVRAQAHIRQAISLTAAEPGTSPMRGEASPGRLAPSTPAGEPSRGGPVPLPSLLAAKWGETMPLPQVSTAMQPPAALPGHVATRGAAPAEPTRSGPAPERAGPLRTPLDPSALSRRLLRLGSDPAPEPEVHISIGRIEIRAAQTPTREDRAKPSATPLISLDEYLRQRNGGGRHP